MASSPVSPITETDLEFVGKLVREAGQVALHMRSNITVKSKGHPRDFVTEADVEVSRILVEAISHRFPTDSIVSEEEASRLSDSHTARVWLIDSIDGTENYIANDGMYSVMVGLLIDGKPAFGWVYNPPADALYCGTPDGAFVQSGTKRQAFGQCRRLHGSRPVRVMMGNRDREQHPWVNDIAGIEWVKQGSVGLRVASILNDEADVYVHLAGKLKSWDTAGPAAIAGAGGMEVACLDGTSLQYDIHNNMHAAALVFGRPGTLSWCQELFRAQGGLAGQLAVT